ncbi:hypothetical protein K438DRAFT_1936890, partial [Mycena galopus ATCC 62051]
MADDGTTSTQDCSGDDTCLRHFEYKTSIGRCHKDFRNVWVVVPHPAVSIVIAVGSVSTRTAHTEQPSERCLGGQVTSGSSDVPALPQGQSAGQSTSSALRSLGQYNRNNWKDATHINDSGIRVQQPTVPITGLNMAALRSNNLATTECYIFILEPFINSKGCTFLSTFEVIREASLKFSDVVANGITSFNSSWEQESEASLVRMNNVHIEIEPQAVFRDVLQTILKDSGQSLDKTAPTKFRNRKLPIAHSSTPPPVASPNWVACHGVTNVTLLLFASLAFTPSSSKPFCHSPAFLVHSTSYESERHALHMFNCFIASEDTSPTGVHKTGACVEMFPCSRFAPCSSTLSPHFLSSPMADPAAPPFVQSVHHPIFYKS